MYKIEPTDKKPDDSTDARTHATSDTQPLTPITNAPQAAECARDLEQHPAVRDATALQDCQSAFVEVTLAADTQGIPAGVVRILYRRRLAIVDVTPVARRHLLVTARPRRWAA